MVWKAFKIYAMVALVGLVREAFKVSQGQVLTALGGADLVDIPVLRGGGSTDLFLLLHLALN